MSRIHVVKQLYIFTSKLCPIIIFPQTGLSILGFFQVFDIVVVFDVAMFIFDAVVFVQSSILSP